jgi:hypothetical protein
LVTTTDTHIKTNSLTQIFSNNRNIRSLVNNPQWTVILPTTSTPTTLIPTAAVMGLPGRGLHPRQLVAADGGNGGDAAKTAAGTNASASNPNKSNRFMISTFTRYKLPITHARRNQRR